MFRSCEMCMNGFSTPKECADHIKSKHLSTFTNTSQSQQSGPSSLLPHPVTNFQPLNDHKISKKIQSRNKYCYFCFKSFNKLNVHMRVHTAEKSFKCPICFESFRYLSTCRSYTKRHNERWMFVQVKLKCPLCFKKILPRNLDSHIKIHSLEQNMSCYFCRKLCGRKSDLNRHLRTHTGEKPFRCGICQGSFGHSSSYRFHMKPSASGNLCRGTLVRVSHKRHSQRNVSSSNRVKIHAGKPPQPCYFCGNIFSRSSTLNTHMRIHTGEKPFRCEICLRTFKNSSSYRYHRKVYNYKVKQVEDGLSSFTPSDLPLCLQNLSPRPRHDTILSCYFCRKLCVQKSRLDSHLRIHTGENPFKCQICWKSFRHSSSWRYHVKSHSKLSSGGICRGKCPLCLKKVASWNLENHLKMHSSGQQARSCYFCCKTFDRKYQLDSHLRLHTEERPFRCGSCGKCYRERSGYNYHTKAYKDKLFGCRFMDPGSQFKTRLCYFCSKTYTNLESFKTHLRIHTRERPYGCGSCGKCYRESGSYRYHVKIHTRLKYYRGDLSIPGTDFKSKCPLCLKKVPIKFLKTHLTIHSQKETRSCYFCTKTCKTKTELTTHLRIHTGEKPFLCGVCRKTYGIRSSYRYHKKRHAKD